MDNIQDNDVNNLLKLLEPELDDFRAIVRDMVKINSSYRNEFNYMQMLINSEKYALADPDKKVNLLIQELNQFGGILAKITEDDEAMELYVNAGLLDKCMEFQKKILNKVDFARLDT